MTDLNKNNKNQNSVVDIKKRRRNNEINSFLNKYFKGVVVLVVLFIFLAGIIYIIIPRFQKTSSSSSRLIKDRKLELIREFQTLKDYQAIISEYSNIGVKDINRINKMIPLAYSREDLFIEMSHFLLENNFKADSLVVSDPNQKEEEGKYDAMGRRNIAKKTEDTSLDLYLKSLPIELGVWLIDLELNDIDYPNLKRFLSLIEKNLKISDIYSLNFNPEDQSLQVQILTYYQKK